MKNKRLAVVCVLMLSVCSIAYSDDTTVTLDGNTSSSGFSVNDSSGTSIARFGGDGNVGIGTTTPEAKLDINGVVKANSFSGSWDNSQNGYIRIGDVQIMWGINTSDKDTITFSPAFETVPSVSITSVSDKSDTTANNIDLASVTTSNATVNTSTYITEYHWIAIGRWQ